MAFVGCSGQSEDTAGPDLPAADTDVASDNAGDTSLLGGADTGETNDSPADTLEVIYEGIWELSPQGGPYKNMTGSLQVTEILNGEEDQPWCTVTYALTGTETDEDGCSYCDVTIEVLHYLSSEGLFDEYEDPILQEDEESKSFGVQLGLREQCMDPNVPEDQDRWIMSFAEEDDMIHFNYYGTGVWVPWYSGQLVHDTLTFGYRTEVGFMAPEDDA
jgi:hypothetical protein